VKRSAIPARPHGVGSGKQFLFDAREKGERVVYVGALVNMNKGDISNDIANN